MTPRPERTGSPRPSPSRWLVALLATLIVAGCGSQGQTSPAVSSSPAAATLPTDTAAPSVSPGSASPAPASLGPTAALAEGFRYSDILKVQVNRLAARIAPKRTAAQVHAYDISGPAPIDGGLVRLEKGDLVSVQFGPLRIGDTTWYLVWPAPGSKLRPGGLEWYTSPPPDSSPVPAWVAASVGSDVYLSLQRRPALAEIETVMPFGLNVAGGGNYESGPLPRHDLFLLDWGAAAPTSGTSCAFNLALVPADGDFTPEVPIKITTTTVKVSELNGFGANVDWLPIPEGSWETLTVRVTSTCSWAFRFVRLDHD